MKLFKTASDKRASWIKEAYGMDVAIPTEYDPSALDKEIARLEQENMAAKQKAEQEYQEREQKTDQAQAMLRDLIQNPTMEKAQQAYQTIIKGDPELAQYEGITEQQVKSFSEGRRQKIRQFNASRGEDDQAFDDAMAFNDKFIDAFASLKIQNLINGVIAQLQQQGQPQQGQSLSSQPRTSQPVETPMAQPI